MARRGGTGPAGRAGRASPVWRIRWAPLAALTVGVAAGLVLAAMPWSHATPLVGGAPLVPYSGAVPRFGVPMGYHIVYRVTAPGIAPYTEALWVERPFESLDETLSGPPPGGALDLARSSLLGSQVLRTGSSEGALIHVPAGPPQSDVRLDAVVGPALREGYLLDVGQSVVLGRRCTVFRSGSALETAGGLVRLKPGQSFVDSCLDDQGLLLSEQTYSHGRLKESRRAVSVQVGASAGRSGDYRLPAVATAFDQGGGSFDQVTLSSSPPGLSWAPSWVPPGFEHYGRYAVVPSQPQAFDQSQPANGAPNPLGLPGSLVTELDDVYVSGPNMIVIEQGVTIGGGIFRAPRGQVPVELGPVMGAGQLSLSATESVVSAEPDRGSHFVRVGGTVDPSVLLEVARSLRIERPGHLVNLAPGPAPASG